MVNKTQPSGKPTVQQDARDKNIGQREADEPTQESAKPTVEKPAESQKTEEENEDANDDERGTNYGQREGSTISEDNDVE
jgi:hypothetical protein